MAEKSLADDENNQQPAEDSLPIDYEAILEEFNSDKEFLKDIINTFITHGKSQIENIRSSIREDNRELLSSEAHSMKGAAANLRANSIFKSAINLNEIVNTATTSELNVALESLDNEFIRFKEYVNKLTW